MVMVVQSAAILPVDIAALLAAVKSERENGIIRAMEDEAIVRAATLGDAERIFALIGRNTDMLVPRSLGSVV